MSLETTAFGAAQIDPFECLVVKANRRLCEITGYNSEELVSLQYFNLVHPEELPRNSLFFKKVTECRNKLNSIETRFIRKQGDEVWVIVLSAPARVEHGPAEPISLLIEDVSHSRRAQENWLHSRKNIGTILESIADIIITYDRDWRYTNLNPEAESALGRPKRDLIGRVLWDVFPELKETEIYRRYIESVCSGIPAHFEAVSPVTGKWHEYHFYPMDAEYCVYMRDITKRKQAEEALRESEEKFKAIFEGSNDAIMLLDEEGFLDCNSQTLKMFGFTTKEAFIKTHPGDNSPFLQPDGKESSTAALEHIRTALERGYDHYEWTYMRLSGRPFPCDVLLTVLKIQNRKVLQAVVRDITDLKRAEESLQTDRRRLESMVRERTAQMARVNKSLRAEIGRAQADGKKTALGAKKTPGDGFGDCPCRRALAPAVRIRPARQRRADAGRGKNEIGTAPGPYRSRRD